MPDRTAGASRRPVHHTLTADARHLPLVSGTIDLVVTSPPYWRKRDYGIPGQLGQEATPADYVDAHTAALAEEAGITVHRITA
jgi:DNA modification methylase